MGKPSIYTPEQRRERRREYNRQRYQRLRETFIARANAWRRANPDKLLRKNRRARGIVGATGERRISSCEICGKISSLCCDHNHLSGKIRGWICRRCNIMLGWYEKVITENLEVSVKHYLQREL